MSSTIRKKLIDHMEFYGLSPHTQKGYITGVKGLAKYYNQSPNTLTNDQVRAYFHHLLRERKLQWSFCQNYLSGITEVMFAGEVISLLKPFLPRCFRFFHKILPLKSWDVVNSVNLLIYPFNDF